MGIRLVEALQELLVLRAVTQVPVPTSPAAAVVVEEEAAAAVEAVEAARAVPAAVEEAAAKAAGLIYIIKLPGWLSKDGWAAMVVMVVEVDRAVPVVRVVPGDLEVRAEAAAALWRSSHAAVLS
jgi:hypothetical protein